MTNSLFGAASLANADSQLPPIGAPIHLAMLAIRSTGKRWGTEVVQLSAADTGRGVTLPV
jgi:hypothetical protein